MQEIKDEMGKATGGAPGFIQEFHSIDGISIKDRQHSFHRLLQKHSNKLNKSELDAICSNLQPKTHLEKIFRVDFLIHFKRNEELFNEFQNGDEITICKIVKHDWFFKQTFEEYSADDFVNSILPSVSFSARMKILKKFSGRNEEKNDEIFDALRKRYGVSNSSAWLSKCSAVKIREIIEKYPNLRLRENQLETIFEKDKNLIMLYCERLEPNDYYHHKKLLALVARQDPEMYVNFMEKHKNIQVNLGRRNTRRFIKAKKKEILGKPENFIQVLNQSALRRKLGADSVTLIRKLFPETNEDLSTFSNTKCYKFLVHFPRRIRFDTFRKVYNDHFYDQFGENVQAISDQLLQDVIVDKFEREKYALLRYSHEENQELFRFFTPETCWEDFTSKMAKMGMGARAKFVKTLMQSCTLNRDASTLLKVAELVSTRLKNDDFHLHINFIFAIVDDEKMKKLLEEEHYQLIFKIYANDAEKRIFREYNFRFSHFAYLHNNNKEITDEILFESPKILNRFEYWFFLDQPKLFRKILVRLLESPVPKELEEENSETSVSMYANVLLEGCFQFNKRFENERVEMLDYEVTRNILLKMLKYKYVQWGHDRHIADAINTSIRSKHLEEFIEELFKLLHNAGNAEIIKIMLSKHPELFHKHFERFLDCFQTKSFVTDDQMWNILKKFTHLGFDRRVIERCIAKLNSGEAIDNQKENYIRPLSQLMDWESYHDFIQRFIPEESKVDFEDKAQKEKYSIQAKIAWSLTHKARPSLLLPTILGFCKGDFTRKALKPLYSNLYRLPENKTGEFLEKLSQAGTISVKKHGLYLTVELCDEETVLKMLKTSPVRCLIPAIKYLKKNPSEKCWELVEANLGNLERSDEPFLEKILQIGFPQEFTGRFFETLWKIFAKCNIKKYNKSLLKKLDKKTIKQVSEKFASDLIEENLFESEEIDDFLILLYLYNYQKSWYGVFLRSLERLKEKGEKKWSCKVNKLVTKFYRVYESNLEFIEKFSGDFTRIFSAEEFFEEIIILELLKQKGKSNGEIAKFILDLQNKIVEKYGELVLEKYQSTVYNVTLPALVIDEERFNFLAELSKLVKNRPDYLLLIHLLPCKLPETIEKRSKYTSIIDKLSSVEDFIVEMRLNSYFKTI